MSRLETAPAPTAPTTPASGDDPRRDDPPATTSAATTETARSGRPSAPSALRRTLRIVRPHIRGHRAVMGLGGLALLFEVVFRVLEPWPVKLAVDAVTVSLGASTPGPAASLQLLLACGLATVSIVGLRALSNYLATVAFALAGSRIATALRQRVFEHVTGLSARFHSRSRSGDVVQRLVGDVGRLQEVATTAGLPLLANVVTLVAMTGVMAWLDPVLAITVVAAAAVYAVLARTGTPQITHASRRTRRSEGDLANLATETIGGIRVVHAYNLRDSLSRRFQGSNRKSLKDGVKARRLAAALERRTDVVVGIATAVVLVVGGLRVVDGAMTPGDLVLFLTYLKTSMKPLRDMAKYTGRIARATASGERVADLLDEQPEITTPAEPAGLDGVRGELTLTRVHADHGDGRPVLRGLSLHVPAGQRIAVVGPSGAGKSTLASLLVRMLDPTRGSVRLDGHDLRELDLDELRRHVSLVLQEAVLFTGTIADNIRQGDPDATDEQVRAAARAARIETFVDSLPDGFDTLVGERGGTMSGGQRQRIAIARAILRQAPVVVLDEPTTGLDADNATAVRAGLARLTRGCTTVVITHDEATARECDRIVWLEDGVVAWDGPADGELPATAGVLDAADPQERR